LLDAAAFAAPAQGREVVRKAVEVFFAAATDAGDRRRRALLMLSACSCPLLSLETGRGSTARPSAIREAMRAAVQGLVSALEGNVEADMLHSVLREFIARSAFGQLRGAEEAMHLLCRIAEPLVAPPCSRGPLGDESGDSESEASELDRDDVEVPPATFAASAKVCIADAKPGGDETECRMIGVASLLETSYVEAGTAEDGTILDEDGCSQPLSPLEEFLAGMSISAAVAANWPVLYPGPGSHGLQFHADFEGGNLRRARLQCDGAVEVLLCGDTNRSSYCQWFFFDVEVAEPVDLRIRIVSFIKPGSTFAAGQRIVTRSGGAGWRRDGRDYAYVPNRYVIGGRRRNYTLAFTLSLALGRTRVALFYPYLFGDLLRDVRRLRPSGDWLRVQDLGPTPGGRPLLVFTITDFGATSAAAEPDVRTNVVISARVHPGEVPASFMMRGVLELLLSDAEEAHALRRSFRFVMLPMLNPDGVAAGNGRANSAGHDLNRCWGKPHQGSEIVAAKRLLEELRSSPGGLLAFLDLHAHSRRHGAFTLSNPATQTLPDVLAGIRDPVFDRRQCVFSYNKSKRGSARCVIWKELGVEHAHTGRPRMRLYPARSG